MVNLSRSTLVFATLLLSVSVNISTAHSFETLDKQLQAKSLSELASETEQFGDPRRGAIVFYQQYMACTKCHGFDQVDKGLGPNLAELKNDISDEYLIDSVLYPSKHIKKGYETTNILTTAGKQLSGLVVKETDKELIIRDAANNYLPTTIIQDDIESIKKSNVSIMPAGQVNSLFGKQSFYDLISYIKALRDGGLEAARELEPAPSLYATRPLPEYENRIDHAGLIQSLDDEAFERGKLIYNRLCINCHGTKEKAGSLPNALRFASGKFKNGNDPFRMYQTVTRGFGMMIAQSWMVPQQKYDVIHYIRQAYLKPNNSAQYFEVSRDYLSSLPKGETFGPEPSNITPWEQMDYGPNLISTYEIGKDASNFAYKGNAIRLDHGPGGVSQGKKWMIFDEDTLRVAAAWEGETFIDYNGIHFNGRHNAHPHITGSVLFENPNGPGWAHPETGSFEDTRLLGRDERHYGPIDRSWAKYEGMYSFAGSTIVQYKVGKTNVLEMPELASTNYPVIKRVFNIGPRDKTMTLAVLKGEPTAKINPLNTKSNEESFAFFGSTLTSTEEPLEVPKSEKSTVQFDGSQYVQIKEGEQFNLHDQDFTIVAKIKTKSDGTIFAKTADQNSWVHDGKSLFIRGGRLTYDIGWVGAVRSNVKINDNKWHDIALTYDAVKDLVKIYIDGKLSGQGNLAPKEKQKKQIIRIGFTSKNFPSNQSFRGKISSLAFYQKKLDFDSQNEQNSSKSLIAKWGTDDSRFKLTAGQKLNFAIKTSASGPIESSSSDKQHLVGIAGDVADFKWSHDQQGHLRLTIPAGKTPLQFTLYVSSVSNQNSAKNVLRTIDTTTAAEDLISKTQGGPTRWPEPLKTIVQLDPTERAFAQDVLTHPVDNPWFCRMRFTGLDFLPDNDSLVACTWDGNVFKVTGLSKLAESDINVNQPIELTWRRIASGLFQPLGIKYHQDQIYVSCRDQICILHDLNSDGETDFYENFNNDHQVTEHFHEFAMGLQIDDQGNFYYAKSARHAKTALVPHHGTLLRVSPDGQKTEILATGFRAANGVCINPDGSFIVTDQEGHWNPKNRINWVTPGGFYGNMYGYHDVTDESDEAMDPPLCWITNQFDRSPSELLWVNSEKWGPLNGQLLNLSYGYGKVYVVPHEEVNGIKQGGMCALPVQFPTGTMRGRFNPNDGQLYLCGMFAWGSSQQQQAGGLYRLRYTGKPAKLPVGLHATSTGVKIKFSDKLDPQLAAIPESYKIKAWDLKRTKNYGSKHYNERSLVVKSATLAEDGSTVILEIPDIEPTWGMEIKCSLKTSSGGIINNTIHNTIHHLAD